MGNCCKAKNDVKEIGATNLLEKLIPDLPQETKVAVLKLKAASNLPSSDAIAGLADPYFQLKIYPADLLAGEQNQKSSIKPRTLNPVWDPAERFQFICSNMSDTKIILSLYSDGVSESLGDAALPAKDLTDQLAPVKLKLVNPDNGKFCGEVDVEGCLMDPRRANTIQQHIVYEYERWQPVVHWGHDFPGHFLPTDPGRWSNEDCSKFGNSFENVAPPLKEGWEEITSWEIRMSTADVGGWKYSSSFHSTTWYDAQGFGMYVRRRPWVREVAARIH